MAVSKKKKVLQISFPKETAEQLQAMEDAFKDEGFKVTKSEILLQAFNEYLERIMLVSEIQNQKNNKEEKK